MRAHLLVMKEELITIRESIWNCLSKKDIAELHRICDKKIENYFENLC